MISKKILILVAFLLVVPGVFAAWSVPTSGEWHDANEVRVTYQASCLGPCPEKDISLQDYINLKDEGADLDDLSWDSTKTVWHSASNIKLSVYGGVYSLQDYISEDFTTLNSMDMDWSESTHKVWHDADEIKVTLSSGAVSLQEWVNDREGEEEPIIPETDSFFREGDSITIYHTDKEKYLSVNDGPGIAQNGVNANKNSVDGDREIFQIKRIRVGDGDEFVDDEEEIRLVSKHTGERLKYVKPFWFWEEQWIHANGDKLPGLNFGNGAYDPIITKYEGTGKIECGDEIYFIDDDDQYLDADFSKNHNPTHRGSRNRFTIFDESGGCAGSEAGVTCATECTDTGQACIGGVCITGAVEDRFTLEEGDSENYKKQCSVVGDKKVAVYTGEVENDVIAVTDGFYEFSCTYGNEGEVSTRRYILNDEYKLLVTGKEKHLDKISPVGRRTYGSRDDVYGWYVKVVESGGAAEFEFAVDRVREESCRIETNTYEQCYNFPRAISTGGPQLTCELITTSEEICSSASESCPIYDHLEGFFIVRNTPTYAWEGLTCSIEVL
tara:strand:- start:2205 stop:3866 length:1662 start_codon:yes stop_codon:yes gene_type:complete